MSEETIQDLTTEDFNRLIDNLKSVQIKAEYTQSLETAEPLECGSPVPLW